MADKNQLKIANQIDFSDDDPFAELTRIMGFDPRQPATRAQPAPAPAAAVNPAPAPSAAPVEQDAVLGDDDFSLDLEKELFGSFDLEDDVEAQSHAPTPVEDIPPQAPSGRGTGASADDFDFAIDFEAAMGVADVSGPAATQTPPAADLDSAESDAPAFASPESHAAAAPQDDFDFALSDVDMHGLADAAASSPAPVEAPAVAEQPETADIDFGLFEDFDFSLAEESAAAPGHAEIAHDDAQPRESDHGLETEFEAEPEIEIDEAAFAFSEELSGQDERSYAEPEAAGEPETFAEPETVEHHAFEPSGLDDVSFDDMDFAVEPVAEEAEPAVAEAPFEAAKPEPAAPGAFEFSIPAYVPRKLPVSPMDVAAEEFRQREAASAAPAFNLEDELNALLGNVRAEKKPEPAVEPMPAPASASGAPVYDTPAYEPTPEASLEPSAHVEAPVSASLPTSPMEVERAQASAGFETPEHSVDIDDGLNWEFDEAFAADAAPAPAEEEPAEIYADDAEPEYQALHHPPYHDDRQPEQAYAAEDDELLAPIDLDDAFGDLSDEPQHDEYAPSEYASSEYAPSYGHAFAGASAAAVAGAASGFSSADQQPGAVAWNAGRLDQGGETWAASSHRDPVVRGNPLKEDPLNVIEKLADQYSRGDVGSYSATGSNADRDEFDDDFDISEFFDGQPEVETVEVDDRSVSLADDFEIPDLPEEEQVPPASAYDDLDAEFSSLLGDMNAEIETGKPAGVRADPLAGGFDAGIYNGAASAQSYADASSGRPQQGNQPDPFQLDDALYEGLVQSDSQYAGGDYEFEPEFEQEYRQPAAAEKASPFSRNLLIGGLVAAVAVIGAIGAFALSFGGGQETPTLVRADDGPVKVRPENPGGATVPNQDNKVYDAVAGDGGDGAPRQEALVTTAEEPVDVAPPAMEDDDMMMSGKSEDRIEQIVRDAEDSSDAELVAVAPRKVRTMVVRPDGTLVPREDEPGDATADTMSTATPSLPEAEAPVALAPAATEEPAGAPLTDDAPAAEAPQEAAPAQVAAATTAAASAGGWAMQIASQPSEAAAQTSYQDLARRYASVLGSRQVNIVKAEVAGKGTFWRVRVLADSRNEAISLCETYKAAGGSCFVSR